MTSFGTPPSPSHVFTHSREPRYLVSVKMPVRHCRQPGVGVRESRMQQGAETFPQHGPYGDHYRQPAQIEIMMQAITL